MKNKARTTAIVLLIFLGISALFGAVALIIDPTGGIMELPREILEGIPFESYLFPAILLGIFNGLLSLVFAILVVRKVKLQAWLVLFQGGVLIVWLTVEVIMGLFFAALTVPYFIIGVLLVVAGLMMLKQPGS
ncbi:MAG: hypothetical protein KAT15_15240 [Bacteroidales bacterium]|nr:hypothetical protein [Bacteroidales bacterium]